MLRKVLYTAAAKVFSTVGAAVLRLVSLPLFVSAWGTELYGEWLILSAAFESLAMADVGFAAAAGNDMTLRVAGGDREGATRSLHTATAFLLAVVLACLGATLLLVSVLPVGEVLGLRRIDPATVGRVLVVLVAYAGVSMLGRALSIGFRSDGNMALGEFIVALIALTEGVAAACAAFFGASLEQVAAMLLSCRVAGLLGMAIVLRRRSPWLELGVRFATWRSLRQNFEPGLGFFSFAVSDAAAIQGVTLAVGTVLGPAAVTTLTAARTVLALIQRVMAILLHSIWPEMTALMGKGDYEKVQRVFVMSVQVTAGLGLGLGGVMAVSGAPLVELWTQGQVPFDGTLWLLLLVASMARAIWQALTLVCIASNQVRRWGMVQLSVMVLSATAVWAGARATGSMGSVGVPVLAADLVLIAAALRESAVLLGTSARTLGRAILDARTFVQNGRNFLRDLYRRLPAFRKDS